MPRIHPDMEIPKCRYLGNEAGWFESIALTTFSLGVPILLVVEKRSPSDNVLRTRLSNDMLQAPSGC